MKFINKIFAVSVAALAALTGCSVNEYEPATVPDGVQVYISNENPSTYTITDGDESINLDVLRVDASAAAQYAITVTDENKVFYTSGKGNLTASFAEGETKTTVSVPLNWDRISAGNSYTLVFTIKDSHVTTIYGLSSFTMTVVASEPYVLLGTATICDDIFTTYYDVDPGTMWECEVYTNPNKPGYYFFKNAYTSTCPFNDAGDYVTEDVYFSVNASSADQVYVPYQTLGVDWGYGQTYVASCLSSYFSGVSDAFGTLKDNIISFPAKAILTSASDLESWYYCCVNGAFKIYLPGAEMTDYSVEAAYTGMFVDPAGNASPVLSFSCGADVAGVSYLFIPQTGDVNAAYANLIAGTGTQTVTVNNGTATIQPALEPGLWYVLYCAVDEAGNRQENSADILDFYFSGSNAETPAVDAELQLMDVTKIFSDETLEKYEMGTYNAIGFALFGSEIKSVKALCAATSTFEYYEAQGVSAETLCENYGSNWSDSYISAINSKGYYANAYTGLKAETSYTMVVIVTNSYGASLCLSDSYSTTSLEYDGELVIGEYNDFSITYTGTTNKYVVNNLLLNNGSEFNAVYDPTANTLTLDGTEYGYESYGSSFGSLYAYYNSAKTQVYGYLVFSAENISNNDAEGDDPLVFNVDPDTHRVTSYASAVYVPLFKYDESDGITGFVGYCAQREIGTTVTKTESTAKAAGISMKKPVDVCNSLVNYSPVRKLNSVKAKASKRDLTSCERAF